MWRVAVKWSLLPGETNAIEEYKTDGLYTGICDKDREVWRMVVKSLCSHGN